MSYYSSCPKLFQEVSQSTFQIAASKIAPADVGKMKADDFNMLLEILVGPDNKMI